MLGPWATNEGPVYHHEIFDRLVYVAAGIGSYGRFPVTSNLHISTDHWHEAHTPEGEQSQGDITAYKPDQEYWGPNPRDRPDVLRQWQAPVTRQNPGDQPGLMRFNGRTVLDWKGNEIREFSNLPKTISSKVEGWRVEAWTREDPRLKLSDIMARLRTVQRSNGDVEPKTNVRIISSRTTRFRDKAGLISWNPRPDAALKIRFLETLRTSQQRANNQSICRDLTSLEMNQMRGVCLGTRRQQTFGRSHNAYVDRIHRRSQGLSEQAPSPAPRLSLQGLASPQPTQSQRSDDHGTLYESDVEYDGNMEEDEDEE